MALAFWMIFQVREYRDDFFRDFKVHVPREMKAWAECLTEMGSRRILPRDRCLGVVLWVEGRESTGKWRCRVSGF